MEIKKLGDVSFAERSRQGSIYEGIFVQMKRLRRGEVLVISIPDGVSSRTFQNRLNASQAKRELIGDLHPPKNCRWVKRTLEGNKLGILCISEKHY